MRMRATLSGDLATCDAEHEKIGIMMYCAASSRARRAVAPVVCVSGCASMAARPGRAWITR